MGSPSSASKNSWFFLGWFIEVDAPFLKPIYYDMVEFSQKKLSYCAEYLCLCGVTGLCDMYQVIKHDIFMSLVDPTKPHHGCLFSQM